LRNAAQQVPFDCQFLGRAEQELAMGKGLAVVFAAVTAICLVVGWTMQRAKGSPQLAVWEPAPTQASVLISGARE
jgi:hypothetical protein